MKCTIFTLLFLFIHTLLLGQADWGKDIKKAFREENYEEVIDLCVRDAKSYPKKDISKHTLERNRMHADAEKCLGYINDAQSDINKAKTSLEKVIKIRKEIWYLVGKGKPITHPKTKPLFDSIIRKLSNPALISWGGKKKESAKIKKEFEVDKLKRDSILGGVKKIEKTQEEIISILGEQVAKKDSTYQALEKEKEELQRKYNILEETLKLQWKGIAKLDSVIQIQRKGNFLPFGIKQCQNGRKALGYTFLVSEIALPIALGFGLEHAADQKYKKHKRQQAETLSDHMNYYEKYKDYHRAAIWAPIATGVLVYGVNVLCNHYCSIKTSDIALHPAVEVDHRGKVQYGVGMSFNF